MKSMRGRPEQVLVLDPSIPSKVARQLTQQDEIYCQMCGLGTGDTDEYTGSAAAFFAKWVPNNGLTSASRNPEVRILCSTCKEASKGIATEKPTAIWLLSQVRRAGIQEQKAVFDWLSKKFGK